MLQKINIPAPNDQFYLPLTGLPWLLLVVVDRTENC